MAHEAQSREPVAATEQKDRGLFGLFGKKKEDGQTHVDPPLHSSHNTATPHQPAPHPYGEPQHAAPPVVSHHEVPGSTPFEANQYAPEKHEHGLQGKPHRTHSSSSNSSSDEEEGGRKKEGEGGRKKKGIKDKVKEKLPGHHGDENKVEGEGGAPDYSQLISQTEEKKHGLVGHH
eukprot:Gb_07623 [translate_table: standard]